MPTLRAALSQDPCPVTGFSSSMLGLRMGPTLSIWMNATLSVMYGKLLQMRLPLYITPIGTIARRYVRPVIFTFFLPSTNLVVRASICVMNAANPRCQQVSVIATVNQTWQRSSKQTHVRNPAMHQRLPPISRTERLTKAAIVHYELVEQNHRGAQANPYPKEAD